MADVEVVEEIAAPPLAVYGLVSDVTRMGEWSPETRSCRWLDGASGPAVGARFHGTNRDRWRRWSTTCTVVAAEPGKRFSFDVDYGRVPVSHWSYDFEDTGAGCKVIETWTDRRPDWMARLSKVVMGVSDRAGHNRAGMQATLAALRQKAEHTGE